MYLANDTCSTQDLNTSDVNLFFFVLSLNLKVSQTLVQHQSVIFQPTVNEQLSQ